MHECLERWGHCRGHSDTSSLWGAESWGALGRMLGGIGLASSLLTVWRLPWLKGAGKPPSPAHCRDSSLFLRVLRLGPGDQAEVTLLVAKVPETDQGTFSSSCQHHVDPGSDWCPLNELCCPDQPAPLPLIPPRSHTERPHPLQTELHFKDKLRARGGRGGWEILSLVSMNETCCELVQPPPQTPSP